MGDTRPPVSYPSNEELRAEIERLTCERDDARAAAAIHLEQAIGWRGLAGTLREAIREIVRIHDGPLARDEALALIGREADMALGGDPEQGVRDKNEG